MVGIKLEIFDKIVWLTDSKKEFDLYSINAKKEVLCNFNGLDSIDDEIAYGEFKCGYFYEFTNKDSAIAYINKTHCFELQSKSVMHIAICLGTIICKQMNISVIDCPNVLSKISIYLYDKILTFRNNKNDKEFIEFDFNNL